MSKKYEYKIVPKGLIVVKNNKKLSEIAEKIEYEINQLGAEGWELIQWKFYFLLFKREVE